jgi:hypothetical protein
MNNQLIEILNSGTTGFDRIVDFVKILAGGNSELQLDQVLVISRVLFAVVMIGFIGYFFDRMKQSVFGLESKVKPNDRKER